MVTRMPFEKLSDHYITYMYESIRDQVRADANSGLRLTSEPARARALGTAPRD